MIQCIRAVAECVNGHQFKIAIGDHPLGIIDFHCPSCETEYYKIIKIDQDAYFGDDNFDPMDSEP